MNLFITLLVSRQYLPKEKIREAVEGYRGQNDQAFDRMFERDKDELRELGITVETGSNDKFFEDEIGYRIKRDEVELPDIQLTREESAVVGLAAQVWEHAGLAGESTSALFKLKAAGVTVDTSVLRMVEPRLSASEPSFDTMWEAVTRRIPVTFDYQRPGAPAAKRSVQPWGVISWHGRWYMAGFDTDRQEPRVFRLTRVRGDVGLADAPGSYEVPEGTDLKTLARELYPSPTLGAAVVRVRRGRGQSLRKMAESVIALDDDFDELRVDYASPWELASEIASYGRDAVAISPPDVRAEVINRLRATAKAGA
ncbi:MAG: helix-turn-helix transcriptional regulator [Aeromicrobium sp.]